MDAPDSVPTAERKLAESRALPSEPWQRGDKGGARRLRQVAVWALVFLPFLWLAARVWPYDPEPTAGDYAQYLLHARALLDGRPYTDTGYIYTPYAAGIGPVAYPPGLPVAIAVLFSALGWHVDIGRALELVSAFLFLAVAARYFAQRDDPALAMAVPLFVGLSEGVPELATQVLSDFPFCALCWGAIATADRPGPWSTRRIVLFSTLGTLAIVTRVAGIALVAAMSLYWVLNARERRLAPIVPVALWAVTSWALLSWPPLIDSYAGGFGLNVSQPAHALTGDVPGRVAIATLAARVIAKATGNATHNLFEYRLAVSQMLLYPFTTKTANQAYHIIAIIIMAVGLAGWIRRYYRSFLAAFALGYGGLLLLYSGPDSRYLLPLSPLLVYGFVCGIAVIVRRLYSRARERLPARVALTIAAGLACLAFVAAATHPRQLGMLEYPDVRALFAEARRRAAYAPERWVLFNPRVFTLHTGVPAMGTFRSGQDAAQGELRRRGITHLAIATAQFSPQDASLRELIATRPTEFTPEYRNATFTVYRFHPEHDQAELRLPAR